MKKVPIFSILTLALLLFPSFQKENNDLTASDDIIEVFTSPCNPLGRSNDNIISADVEVESDTNYIKFIHSVIKEATGVKAGLMTGPYGIKFYYANANTPMRDYSFALEDYIKFECNCLGGYGDNIKLTNVPYIQNAEAEPNDSDGNIVIIDTINGRVFDIWGYNRVSWTLGLCLFLKNISINTIQPVCWYANGLAITSTGLYPTGIQGLGGSNVSLLNGAVTPMELAAGEINHPLKCLLPRKCIKYNFYRPPLTSSERDNQKNQPYSIPEGTRLQLDPTIDLNKYNLNNVEKTIAKALQKYGMYLVDTNDNTLDGTVRSGITIVAISARTWPYSNNPYKKVKDFPDDLIKNSHLYNYSFSNTFIDLLKNLRIIKAQEIVTPPKVAKSAVNGSIMEYCQ